MCADAAQYCAAAMIAHWEGCSWVGELVEGRPPVMKSGMLSSLHRVHAGKGRTVLKQLEGDHTEGVDINFEVVGLVSEDLRRHVAI